MRSSRLIRAVLAIGFAAATAPALAQQQRLPAPPAPPRALEFTGPEAGWPPQVRGATDARVLPTESVANVLTPSLVARLGEIAAASAVVRRALGDRFAFIDAHLTEVDKQGDQRPLDQRLARATFYSYSRNVAVRAMVRGGEVIEVADIEGYQPPESPREIEQAVQLAREHPSVRDAARDLEGRAILTEPPEGRPGAGHRVLYVSFLPRGSARAELMALVDMTEGRVLEAGRPASR